jgi:hypothetical protein
VCQLHRSILEDIYIYKNSLLYLKCLEIIFPILNMNGIDFMNYYFLVYLKLVNNRKFLLEKMNRSVTKIKKNSYYFEF